jgi:hypothetical protein
LFAVTVVIYAIVALGPAAKSATTWQDALHLLLPRFLVLSTLYFLIVWAARNFGAARHNQTLNSHRAVALRSFDSFLLATKGSEDLQKSLLREVATATFTTHATGYLKNENLEKGENPVLAIVEAVGDIIKSRKGP